MSFRLQPSAPARLNRCQLFGPGSREALFQKMATSAADVINLDLEDSVAPDDKAQARRNIIQAIGDIDWGDKTLSVRINGLDTPYWYRDVVDLLEQAGERLDQIMIPKVGNAADVYAVDALVTAVEAAKGRSKRIALEVIIESAALTDDEIVAACKASEAAGADFVKTSTGFHPAGGASVHAVELMNETVGGRLGIKASGGIRDYATANAMVEAGATRLGLSGSASVLDGADGDASAVDDGDY